MSPVNQPTSRDEYFLPEWVIGVFYGNKWYEVEEGSLKTISTERGRMTVYVDEYSKEVVFLSFPITGWRIKQREFRPVVVETQEEITEYGSESERVARERSKCR